MEFFFSIYFDIQLSFTISLRITCLLFLLFVKYLRFLIHRLTLSSYTNCSGLNGSSLHAQVDIRSTRNASNVINDADDDFLISQIISQNMLDPGMSVFWSAPRPAAKAGEHGVRMLIIQWCIVTLLEYHVFCVCVFCIFNWISCFYSLFRYVDF